MKRLEKQPQEYIDDVCGTYFRGYCLEISGTYFKQHSHDYDHATLIATGGLNVWVDGKYLGEFKAPKAISIKAGALHCFRSTADNTWFYCVHNLNGEPYKILGENK